MSEEAIREHWEVLSDLISASDREELSRFIESLSSSELARSLSRIDSDEQADLLTLLEPQDAAELIQSLSDSQGADLIEELEPHEAAAIVDEMDSDHRVDVLNELDDEDAHAILERMDPEEAHDVRQLIDYPHDTAGGIMVTEFLSYPITLTVGELLGDIHRNAEVYSDYGVQYAYILSETGTLVGVVRLRDLILTKPDAPVTSIMLANPLYLYVDSTLEEINEFFDRYGFVGVPVTDHRGKLVGVVRRADAEEAASERATQDLMRFGGIVTGEELRSMPAMSRTLRRLAWLLLNLCLSLLASSVILRFESTVDAVGVALVFFMPVIANMSGCSGNQAIAVSIRELSMGIIQPQDYWRVFWKEMQVGAVVSVALAGLLGIVAYVMGCSPFFALAVTAAFGANILVALTIGGLVPLLMRRVGIDPALAGPPILTTCTDMCGFFFLLALASMLVLGGAIA